MANTYKNIVITPNRSSNSDDPKIVFSGANTSSNTDITLRMYPTSNGTLSFEGSAGQLFSITNDLTGTIYSVNDVSGIPSIAVYANGQIDMARYSGNLFFGTTSSNTSSVFFYSNLRAGHSTLNSSPASTAFSHTLAGFGSNRIVNFDGVGTLPSVWWTNGSRAYGAIDAQDPGLTIWSNNGSSWQKQMTINYGNVTINTDIRSPIFYDSDNTGYYVDPASTSVLNRISTVRADNWLYLDNNYGHSVVGVYTSTRYQGVWAMGDSYKLPADGTTTGNLYGIAWSHPNAGGTAGNLNTHGALILENGSFLAALSGSIRCRDDMRAPIFYDSNDTGYYCDPRSASRLSGLRLDGVDNQASGEDAILWINKPNNNDWAMIVTGALDYGVDLRMAASHTYAIKAQANGTEYSRLGTDLFYHSSNIRAPIFYDQNDTNYYLDPAADLSMKVYGEISNSNYNPGNLQPGALNIGRTDRDYGWDSTTWSTDVRAGILANCSELWEFVIHDSGDSVESVFRYNGGDQLLMGRDIGWGTLYIEASNSFRAPIFYDSNDTGYYADPNSTSRLYRTESFYFRNIYGVSTDHPFGLYFDSGESTSYAIYRESGAWSHPYPDLRIAFHTGIKFGANPSYEGMRFYTDYDMSSLVMQVNGGSNYIYKYVWMYTNTTGIYSDTNGAHWGPNTSSSYGSWAIQGSRSGWYGIHFYNGGYTPHLMLDGSGNGGMYYESSGRWASYYSYGNNSWGFGSSTTSSSYMIYASGSIYSTGNVVAASDRRLKENIIKLENSLETVEKLVGVSYNKKGYKKREIGFIAQDVINYLPEVVTYAEDVDQYGINYGNITALLTEAVKELYQQIKLIKNKVGL